MARFRLQETLADVALERGVEIKFSSPVVSIDHKQPAVLLKDGVRMEADLIIGADGKSYGPEDICHLNLPPLIKC